MPHIPNKDPIQNLVFLADNSQFFHMFFHPIFLVLVNT